LAGLDYELYHNLSIRVFYEDATGASGFKVVEVRLNDLNDQPLSFDAPGTPFTTFDLPEQSNIAGTPFLLGDITVNDPDGAPNDYGISSVRCRCRHVPCH
jgi:hypothetical protein